MTKRTTTKHAMTNTCGRVLDIPTEACGYSLKLRCDMPPGHIGEHRANGVGRFWPEDVDWLQSVKFSVRWEISND